MRQDLFTYLGAPLPPTRDCPVFLPGWGLDGRVTTLATPPRPWLTTSRPAEPAEIMPALVEYLTQHQIETVVLVGWSLGAYLALDFAAAHPEKISAIYLLAGRDHWPSTEINAIRRDLAADQEGFLHSFYRKCFLGYRQAGQAFREELEKRYLAELSSGVLNSGLDYLDDIRLAERLIPFSAHAFPIYQVDGAKDVIAPVTDDQGNGTTQRLFRHGGHPLFLEKDFSPDLHLRKAALRRKFSRAATTYDEHATLQKEVAERLAEHLPGSPPATILELGCGTGNYTRLLAERFPAARLTALDFSEGMLAVAQSKLPKSRTTFLCRDAEVFLGECRENFALITANATLQWFDDLARTAALITEHLTPGGTMLATIFGSDGLRELRAGLAAVNPGKVTLPIDKFPNREQLQAIFTSTFAQVEIAEWRLLRCYPSLADLLRHLRRTGTTGPRPGPPLLDRPRFAALEKWFREELGECRISYQIFLVKGSNP